MGIPKSIPVWPLVERSQTSEKACVDKPVRDLSFALPSTAGLSSERLYSERSWIITKGLVKQRKSPQSRTYFHCFFCNRVEKTSQGKMSIVGFPVAPNDKYLNTCTCVRPVSVFHSPAPWEGSWGCSTGMPHLNWGPVQICRAPASRYLTPREARGLYLQPSHLGFAVYPRVRSDEFKWLWERVVVAAVERAPAISDLHMNFEVFLQVLHRQFFCRMKFSLLLISAGETGGTCYFPCKTYLFTGKRSFFMSAQSVNGVDWE